MNYEEQKTSLLAALQKASGISFNITESSLSEEETIQRLKDILLHYNVLNNKKSFLFSFLTQDLSADDVAQGVHRFHIDENCIRILYLMESNKAYPSDVTSLISNFFPSPLDSCIELDENHLLIILHYDSAPSSDDIKTMALQLLDIMDTEAFVSFKIAYDEPVTSFLKVKKSYSDLILAMKIGNTFASTERVFCFHELGIGRLLFNLPESECRAFLDNHIDMEVFKNIDEETLNTLNAFFENDLSIAETSRQQFIHRNTLIYRLDKFASLTGLDVRRFSDAITCKIALMLITYLDQE